MTIYHLFHSDFDLINLINANVFFKSQIAS